MFGLRPRKGFLEGGRICSFDLSGYYQRVTIYKILYIYFLHLILFYNYKKRLKIYCVSTTH